MRAERSSERERQVQRPAGVRKRANEALVARMELGDSVVVRGASEAAEGHSRRACQVIGRTSALALRQLESHWRVGRETWQQDLIFVTTWIRVIGRR